MDFAKRAFTVLLVQQMGLLWHARSDIFVRADQEHHSLAQAVLLVWLLRRFQVPTVSIAIWQSQVMLAQRDPLTEPQSFVARDIRAQEVQALQQHLSFAVLDPIVPQGPIQI